jgi:hypothetical protein
MDNEQKVLPSIEKAMEKLIEVSEHADAFDRTEDKVSKARLSTGITDIIIILKQALTKI